MDEFPVSVTVANLIQRMWKKSTVHLSSCPLLEEVYYVDDTLVTALLQDQARYFYI